MSELYEAVVRTPFLDAYSKHRWLERQFKERGIVKREYTWTPAPGRNAVVRYHQPLGGAWTWTLLEPPVQAMKIRFKLDSQVRYWLNCRRVVSQDYFDNLDWIQRQAPKLGWKLLVESVDIMPISVPINTAKDNSNLAREFTLLGARFDGIATVEEPEKFAEALAKGIGNGKAFGLGFVMYTVFGGIPR